MELVKQTCPGNGQRSDVLSVAGNQKNSGKLHPNRQHSLLAPANQNVKHVFECSLEFVINPKKHKQP